MPAWQKLHAALEVIPEPVEYLPDSQLRHIKFVYILVPVLYEPASHREHCPALV